MKIKCPNCSATNEIQNNCSNCGSKLLNEGVTIENKSTSINDGLQNPKNKWLFGILILLGIWILGGIVLDLFAAFAGLDGKYASAITFFVGIIVMWWYVSDKSNVEIDEDIMK